MFAFISQLVFHEVCIHIQYLLSVVRNKLQTLNILRTSKVQEKSMSCESALNFDWWKTSENYTPMSQELLSLGTFLQVHSNSKRYSTSLDKMHILTWELTCHVKLKFFLWTKPLENLLLAKYLISATVT